MPKTIQHHINLPPAKLSVKQIEEIDNALPANFQGNLSWIAWAGKLRIEEYTLGDFFLQIEGEQGITELSLSVEIENSTDITLELVCEEKGSFLEYSCPRDMSRKMQDLERVIKSIFLENKRRWWWIPWIQAPILEVGERPIPRLKLPWNRIFENVITNWLSYLLITITALVLGFIIGRVSG